MTVAWSSAAWHTSGIYSSMLFFSNTMPCAIVIETFNIYNSIQRNHEYLPPQTPHHTTHQQQSQRKANTL